MVTLLVDAVVSNVVVNDVSNVVVNAVLRVVSVARDVAVSRLVV